MKILVVCQHFYPENFRINDVCKELVKRGNDVTVLTGLPNYPKGKVLKEYKWFKNRKQYIDGIKIIRTSLVGRGTSSFKMIINYLWFAFFGSLKAFFMKKDFDIVYVYQLSPITMTWPAIVVKKMKKIPLVIHVLDQWPVSITTGGISKKSITYKIVEKISKESYNYADLITCSSRPFKHYFIKELGLAKEKKFIYLPSYAESNYIKTKTKNNDYFDLLFAGNIGPAVSVETIIEAARVLKNNHNIKFHIVGDGLSKNKCEKLANDYGLKNIKFYGSYPVEEMDKFYELADAFLITMLNNEVVNNTLPAKLQSYMAAGKPIIGAISGEAYKVINEAKCGLCCSSLDYNNLARLIEKASTSKDKNKWAKNAYSYYINNFDKNKCIDDLETTLEKQMKEEIVYYSSSFEKFTKYVCISGLSLIIDLFLFNIFSRYIMNNILDDYVLITSTICARIISSLFNYYCNKNIAFKSYNKTSFIKYYLLCAVQMLVSGILLEILFPKLKINTLLLKLIIDILIFIANFIIQKLWVFKGEK